MSNEISMLNHISAKEKKNKTKGEDYTNEVSLTVDKQVDKLRDLLIKHVNGGELPNIGRSVYHDGNDTFETDETLNPDFDLTDIDRINSEIIANKKQLEEVNKRISDKKKEEDEKKLKAEKTAKNAEKSEAYKDVKETKET